MKLFTKKLLSLHIRLTSSNFLHINVNALKIAFVDPVTVTIRSGHEPSDMFILAPDCKYNRIIIKIHFMYH